MLKEREAPVITLREWEEKEKSLMLFQILAGSRFLLAVPVIGCVLLTLGVVLMGFGRIVTAGVRVIHAGDFSV